MDSLHICKESIRQKSSQKLANSSMETARFKLPGHKNELCFFWNTLLGSIKELIITMTSMTTITSMTTMATMTTMTTES